MSASVPSAFIAARLLERHAAQSGGLIYLCASERRASDIAGLLRQLAPEVTSLFYPAWDCLPYDRASPSSEAMGARMAVLKALAAGGEAFVVVTTPEALIQRTPPQSAVSGASLALQTGEAFDLEAAPARLQALGYRADDRVDEPGEYAVRGEVVDVYGAADPLPHRLEVLDGQVHSLRAFDPLTQRSTDALDRLEIGAGSEVVFGKDEAPTERRPGLEHALAAFYPELETLFDYAAGSTLLIEPGAEARTESLFGQIEAAYKERARWSAASQEAEESHALSPPDRLYLTREAWERRARKADALDVEGCAPVPKFALDRSPGRALSGFVAGELGGGRRIVLGAASRRDAARLSPGRPAQKPARRNRRGTGPRFSPRRRAPCSRSPWTRRAASSTRGAAWS